MSQASITLRRRIEWIDTDAAGIYHWTTVFRLAEAAEAALLTELGIAETTFGHAPRVAVSFDFTKSLRFNDVVDVRLAVETVGRASLRYAVAITGPDGLAAQGHITVCFVDPATGAAGPWPDAVRHALEHGGEQHPSL